MRSSLTALAGFVAVMGVSTAHGQLVLTADTNTLLADTPDQTITFSVASTQEVTAFQFSAQFDEAGSPAFTSLNLITGTIFEPNNFGQFGDISDASGIRAQTLTQSGSVVANGVVATLVVDTTGIQSGAFTLNLEPAGRVDPTRFGDTSNNPVVVTLQNSSFVVPEPASALVLTGAGSLMLLRRRRVA